MMLPRNRFSAIALAAACGFATTARAQAPSTAPATPAAPSYTFTLGGYADYAFDADLKNDNGSFSVFRTGGSVTMDHPLPDSGNDLRVTFNSEYDHYFFRNFGPVPGDDGSDSLDVYQFDVRPTFTHVFNQTWSAFAGLQFTASGMSEAHFDDALSYGAFAGATYRFSPTLSVGAGLGVSTQLEDDPFFFPLLTLNWAITPDLTFSADGLGVRLTDRLSETWSVFASARYEYRQFRFDGKEIVRDGVLTDQAVPITVGVTCTPVERLTISGEVGVVAYRRLEVTDSVGHQVGADEADPAVFAGVRVSYAF